jgi:hypothetical protein
MTMKRQARKSGMYAGFAKLALFGAVSVFMKTLPIDIG